MHLNKLFMHNFKKFRRSEVEFADGLTGIMGSNGAGKSTIVEAIAWSLYGNRASSIKRDFLRNSRAGEADSVEVSLSLSLGNKELMIYRAMKGKNMTPEAFLLLDGQRIAAGTKEVDQRLEDILNISYQDFMKTFYARQKDLDNLIREGGMGKREYLLKLLGLEDIKESALERIKSDRSGLEEKKNRLNGALSEVGDVEARLDEVDQAISLTKKGLDEAERRDSLLQMTREKRSAELEVMNEKMRSHGILSERLSGLQAEERDKGATIKRNEKRLQEIESLRRVLSGLQPDLERLGTIHSRLEVLEPKRSLHEEISLKVVGAKASLEGERRAREKDERRLEQLIEASVRLDSLKGREEEYRELQALLSRLEELRDRYRELQSRQKEDAVRLEGARSNLASIENTTKDLQLARSRYEEIFPSIENEKSLRSQQADLLQQRERQKNLDHLLGQRKAQEERMAQLISQAEQIKKKLVSLGDLEKREAELRRQDKDLDSLGSELNNNIADLRGSLKVQEIAFLESQKSRDKVRSLGRDSLCPTCERPLDEQRDLLIQKYEEEIAVASEEKGRLKAMLAKQIERAEGVTKSRSNLAVAFEDLNSKKSQRSALQADLRNTNQHMIDLKTDLDFVRQKILDLGDVVFDSERLNDIEASLINVSKLVEECRGLSGRLQELPGKISRREELLNEIRTLEERSVRLGEEEKSLGYSESQYIEAKKSWESSRALHEQFITLRERIKEIPALQEKIIIQGREEDTLARELAELERMQKEIGFDPREYGSLTEEKKSLARAEEEANKIRIQLALEPEVKRNLAEAQAALEALQIELARAGSEVESLGYKSMLHDEAKLALCQAEEDLAAMQKELSERRIYLGVLQADSGRLAEEAKRKKEYEKSLQETARMLEVVETTRSLVNEFMDQVLIRVKNDIAKAASEILEEVSGKYSLLKIDEDFNIQVEDGGNYYPISRYSGGEIDMIALSVRVAISEYLMRFGPDEESYSFLILDEIFGSQDIEHRERMIQMLRSLEERFPQIIAISHISDVQGQFDSTLLVVEDEMGNSRVEQN